jgi:hypothetical protein
MTWCICAARAVCRLPVVAWWVWACACLREASERQRVGQDRIASESAGWTGVSSFVSYTFGQLITAKLLVSLGWAFSAGGESPRRGSWLLHVFWPSRPLTDLANPPS